MTSLSNALPLRVFSAIRECQNVKSLDVCCAIAKYQKWRLLFTLDKLPNDVLRHIAGFLAAGSRIAYYESLHSPCFVNDQAEARLQHKITRKLKEICIELQANRYYGSVLIYANASLFTPNARPIARIWVYNAQRIFSESFWDVPRLQERVRSCVTQNLNDVALLGYIDTESPQDLLFITSTASQSTRDMERFLC